MIVFHETKARALPFLPLNPDKLAFLLGYGELSHKVVHLPLENRPCTKTRLRQGDIDPGYVLGPQSFIPGETKA